MINLALNSGTHILSKEGDNGDLSFTNMENILESDESYFFPNFRYFPQLNVLWYRLQRFTNIFFVF